MKKYRGEEEAKSHTKCERERERIQRVPLKFKGPPSPIMNPHSPVPFLIRSTHTHQVRYKGNNKVLRVCVRPSFDDDARISARVSKMWGRGSFFFQNF